MKRLRECCIPLFKRWRCLFVQKKDDVWRKVFRIFRRNRLPKSSNDPTHPYPIKDPTRHDPFKIITKRKDVFYPTNHRKKRLFPKKTLTKKMKKRITENKTINLRVPKNKQTNKQLIHKKNTRTVWPYSTSYWNSNVVPQWSSLWVLPRWIRRRRSFHRSLWSSLGSTRGWAGKTSWHVAKAKNKREVPEMMEKTKSSSLMMSSEGFCYHPL